MNIALPIGKSILTANDVPEILGRTTKMRAETDKLFNGLSTDGQIEMSVSDSPWGTYFEMFRDKYGIEWMVDFDANYKGQLI